jgi:hypothetical protein
MWIESAEGQGTTVSVRLPLTSDPVAADSYPDIVQHPSTGKPASFQASMPPSI